MKRPCFAALGLGVALLGCPASTSNTNLYIPVTGIQIDAAQLVYGIGCGTGPGQVFQYAAVASFAPASTDAGRNAAADAGAPSVINASGVFACFTDGVIGNLPASDAGSFSYTIQIFAYDQASFPAALACPPGTGGSLGQTCPGDVASNVIPLEYLANWTAVCTATQVTGVTVPVVCGPLVPRQGTGADGGTLVEGGVVEADVTLDSSGMGEAMGAMEGMEAMGDATGPADAGVDAAGVGD